MNIKKVNITRKILNSNPNDIELQFNFPGFPVFHKTKCIAGSGNFCNIYSESALDNSYNREYGMISYAKDSYFIAPRVDCTRCDLLCLLGEARKL